MVLGALSKRTAMGRNANRGWNELRLVPEPSVLVLLLSGALRLGALHWLRTRGATGHRVVGLSPLIGC